jgi:hypothetical protein
MKTPIEKNLERKLSRKSFDFVPAITHPLQVSSIPLGYASMCHSKPASRNVGLTCFFFPSTLKIYQVTFFML